MSAAKPNIEPIQSTSHPLPATPLERLRLIRETVVSEGNAVLAAAAALDSRAVQAAELTANCNGCVLVTGVGKAGLVGQKLVATLASTGTPAHFLHPTEAVHGDLGRVRKADLVWAISNSGRSEELVRIAAHLSEQSSGLVAITANEDNPLAMLADCVVPIGRHAEACPNGLAPTSSTSVMMAVGDGIAMLASRLRSFTSRDFARFHPGGTLGHKLAKVDQIMRPLAACRTALQSASIRDAMVAASTSHRRSGALMIVDESGMLMGIFTDSDLARLLESHHDEALDEAIANHMTARPVTVSAGLLLQDAISIMSARKISELPVIDDRARPLGLLDVTDLVALSDGHTEESATLPLVRRQQAG